MAWSLKLRSWNELVEYTIFELKICLVEWKALLFGIAWQYIHSIFHNLAYWMQTKLSPAQRVPLYDQGFELLPEFTEAQSHISEYLVFGGIFGPVILLFVSVLFIKPSPNSRPRYLALIAKRVLLQTAICLMLRCISFLVTSLPGAAPHCRPMYNQTCLDANPNDPAAEFICSIPNPDFDPPMTVGKVFGHIDALNGCGDLMFSSHTTYTMSLILGVWKYWRNVPLLLLMLAVQVAIAFCIVASRKHYSLDVITALYVVPMVWFIQDAYINDLNHKDAEATPEAIKAVYGLDVPNAEKSASQGTLVQSDQEGVFQSSETPTQA
ncbi:unnamed protein product [Aphanomyces euteiches]|uniref:Sphingomyelin synthase-like domain-containing protein n=1 Tax=Aphanomyces euteiches TaxID=100861 RepID=A0A6G0XHI4_9STRA|nr:hypothetical protein Ae201684_004854 [Aphanomyces euteiches]KAH9082372.1 hypothetical protein Ae201684P_009698 [Aphanomyces euteiches]KAH9152279.1 hypothetical protein AeRB84_005265 [Aphanomyces euteiches]